MAKFIPRAAPFLTRTMVSLEMADACRKALDAERANAVIQKYEDATKHRYNRKPKDQGGGIDTSIDAKATSTYAGQYSVVHGVRVMTMSGGPRVAVSVGIKGPFVFAMEFGSAKFKKTEESKGSLRSLIIAKGKKTN